MGDVGGDDVGDPVVARRRNEGRNMLLDVVTELEALALGRMSCPGEGPPGVDRLREMEGLESPAALGGRKDEMKRARNVPADAGGVLAGVVEAGDRVTR
jgi:hypothetical protein